MPGYEARQCCDLIMSVVYIAITFSWVGLKP